MNGTTYLRSYRAIALLGAASFLATVYVSTIPNDYEV
jgi:hypothetical protein